MPFASAKATIANAVSRAAPQIGSGATLHRLALPAHFVAPLLAAFSWQRESTTRPATTWSMESARSEGSLSAVVGPQLSAYQSRVSCNQSLELNVIHGLQVTGQVGTLGGIR